MTLYGIEKEKVMQGLIEGRIVHFVLNNGEHRPAIVVRNWSDPSLPGSDGRVNLQVFLDGSNDTTTAISRGETSSDTLLTAWRTSVHYSEAHEPRTWHWPERA